VLHLTDALADAQFVEEVHEKAKKAIDRRNDVEQNQHGVNAIGNLELARDASGYIDSCVEEKTSE
jgi:hypothetical protein